MATKVAQGTVTGDEYQRLVDEYQSLHKKYKELKETHAECRSYIRKATEKYEAAKQSAKQWCAWLEKRGYQPRKKSDFSEVLTLETITREETDNRHVSSSQATEGEPGCSLSASSGLGCNDEPEFVSARSLKRKRSHEMPPRVRIKLEPTSPDNPIELGSEDYSSPVLKRQKPLRTDTSDLDAHVEHIETPRKRKNCRARSEEAARPTSLLAATSSLSEGDIRSIHVDDACIKAEATSVTHQDQIVQSRDFALKAKDAQMDSNALRQRSVNIPNMPNSSRARKLLQRNLKPEIAFLSEDGDDRTSQAVVQQHEPKAINPRGHRLDTLLEEPSPDRQTLPKRHTPEPKTVLRPESGTRPLERHKPNVTGPIERSSAKFRLPRGLENAPSPPRPEDEPLRSRPTNILSPDDFKVNPNYLGSDFAFADTFRGREQRRCLPGCTRPECCGDAFRKAVEMGIIQSKKTDDQVLEEYLGPDYATHMYAYGPDKRKELLVQARAYAFASEHGKHRQAFERRSTPPGYWRIDMPTTQEEEEDRARAFRLEREKVEERWREAMRGGRWLFRDE